MTVRIENLRSGYRKGFHLKNINLSFRKGSITGIIGPNGSGKSTLLKTAAGTLSPEEGTIFIDDKNLNEYSHKQRGQILSFVPAELYVNFPFTVFEAVLMGRNPYIKRFESEKPDDYDRARRALRATDAYRFKEKKITELSSGELKRVLIARTLCQDTGIVFLDEPEAHLDINYVKVIFRMLTNLKKEGKTIVAVLHDLNLAALYCDEIVVLKKGKIFKKGDADEVISEKVLSELYEEKVSVSDVGGRKYISPRPDGEGK
ncbi:MAG: ABC transporter ATP-binding protein [Elusimicrobiota bacterium]|nr:ABC transporter ATP-binding protein [Elusimicrobiota bacterium]